MLPITIKPSEKNIQEHTIVMQVLESFMDTMDVAASCMEHGVRLSTFFLILSQNPGFQEIFNEIYGSTKSGLKHLALSVVKESLVEKDKSMAKWYLENANNEEFGKRSTVEHQQSSFKEDAKALLAEYEVVDEE